MTTTIRNAIRNAYTHTAHTAIRQPDPAKAAALWKKMETMCKHAINEITVFKGAAHERYLQAKEDAQCLNTPLPKGLFQPKPSPKKVS